MKQKQLTKLELQLLKEKRERHRLFWIGLLTALVMLLTVAGFLIGYSDSDDIDLHTTIEKKTIVQYPQVTQVIENNITNTEIIKQEADVDLDTLQECTQLTRENGAKYIYCPNN